MTLTKGTGAASWLAWSGGAWQVRAGLRTGPTTWSVESLSAPGAMTAEPAVAASSNYRFPVRNDAVVVAWRAFDGEHWRIRARVKRPGEAWTRPVTLSAPGGDGATPAVHVVEWGDGELEPRVLWRYRGSGGVWRLQFARLDADGLAKNPPKTVSPRGHDVRELSVSNDFEAFWTEYDGSHWRLRVGDIAFLQQPGSQTTVSPAGEDVSGPSKATGDFSTAYAWIGSDGAHTRARAQLSLCDPFCLVDPRKAPKPVDISPPGLDAQAVSAQAGVVIADDHYDEYFVFFWRQFDGANWRVATRAKPHGEPWEELIYLSPPGVDASAPVTDSYFAYPEAYAVSVAWTEQVGGHSAARVATMFAPPGPASVPVVETVSSTAVDATVVAVDQAEGLGPGVAWVATGTPDAIRLRGLDTVAPATDVVRMPRLYSGGDLEVRWRAVDDWSPVDHFDVEQETSRWNQSGVTRTERSSTATSAVRKLGSGRSYCFRVRAVDVAGHSGDYLDRGCTTTPVDDRLLERAGAWRARHGEPYYRGTFLESRESGAQLTLPSLPVKRNFAVLLGKGPGYGSVRVAVGPWSAVLDLDRKDVGTAKLLVGGGHTGPVTITVLSNGKPVRVDGVFAEPLRLAPDDCGGRC